MCRVYGSGIPSSDRLLLFYFRSAGGLRGGRPREADPRHLYTVQRSACRHRSGVGTRLPGMGCPTKGPNHPSPKRLEPQTLDTKPENPNTLHALSLDSRPYTPNPQTIPSPTPFLSLRLRPSTWRFRACRARAQGSGFVWGPWVVARQR